MARKAEYEATEYPGIKKRIKNGKYLVVIDLGRQPKLDKKTGEMVLKQYKTQKIFSTLIALSKKYLHDGTEILTTRILCWSKMPDRIIDIIKTEHSGIRPTQ